MKLKLVSGLLLCGLLQGALTTFAKATSEPIDPMEPTLSTVAAGPDTAAPAATEAAEPAPAAPTSPLDRLNPYSVITNRNVFQLTEPSPVVVEHPELAVPSIKLTGLVRMSGQATRALFVSIPKDAKEQTAYFNLAEGERQDNLEVVKILDAEESAEVINAGTKMTVALKDSKDKDAKPGPGAPAGGPMPFPSRAGAGTPPPMPQPMPTADQQQPAPSGGGSSVLVVGAAPAAPSTPTATGIPVPGAGIPPVPGARTIPRPLRPMPQQ